jgi:hypothetical protein
VLEVQPKVVIEVKKVPAKKPGAKLKKM